MTAEAIVVGSIDGLSTLIREDVAGEITALPRFQCNVAFDGARLDHGGAQHEQAEADVRHGHADHGRGHALAAAQAIHGLGER